MLTAVSIASSRRGAPFTGAWIEILPDIPEGADGVQVAPFTGAWIEISKTGLELH